MTSYSMAAELPEGAVVTNGLMILLYIDAEGENRYTLATAGDGQMTSYVGMAAVAQYKLIEMFGA